MIDRKALLRRNAPHVKNWIPESPMTVGNGELAFTADLTGLQTFYEEQKKAFAPLCTMSQWGWHSTPAGEDRNLFYKPEDVIKTPYDSVRGTVYYASEAQPGNEEIYHWLRENPHRLNLVRIGFFLEGREIHPEEIRNAEQVLSIEEGVLRSSFEIAGSRVSVETFCAKSEDTLGFRIESEALKSKNLEVRISFPYGSKDITASDWEHPAWHETSRTQEDEYTLYFDRTLDRDSYRVRLYMETKAEVEMVSAHDYRIQSKENRLIFTVSLSEKMLPEKRSFEELYTDCKKGWEAFWQKAGMIELSGSGDPRGKELERRIVLSQYLLAIQSLGSVPPQETGLTCNSWYGKFHLEMYPWHCGWAPLWNLGEELQGSLHWYLNHLEEAEKNAACNGYRGARWPKMVDRDAIDSPSIIATLLIWQQPHILWMLHAMECREKKDSLIQEFRDVICETAQFMADFVSFNKETGYYDLPSPFIPAQEEHDPRTTKNAAYELEYWSFGLRLAADWAERFGWDAENWREIADHMAPTPVKDELYLACETCPETFTKFAKDHPSMTAACGLLPGHSIQPEIMEKTLEKVLDCWDYPSMWGWDFAMLAMTAVRLGKPKQAVDILLMDTAKNAYVESGNNYQRMRTDLPLYLPGNGSLLLAAAMMTAGYKGSTQDLPGFPKDGSWTVTYENIAPFPY